MYYTNSNGKIEQFGGFITTIFMKTNIMKKAINKIDEKNMNIHMIIIDDFILFFLLTRTAQRAKYIDRIFYVWYQDWPKNDEKIIMRNAIKHNNVNIKGCFSFINFLEMIFKNTKNTFEDKKIAFSQVENNYLNNFCRGFKETREKAGNFQNPA